MFRIGQAQSRTAIERVPSSSARSSGTLSRRHRPDYALLIIALLLSVIGLIVVYSISPGLAITRNVDSNYFVIKQSIAIALGLVAFAIFCNLPTVLLKHMRKALIVASAVGVVVIQFFGDEVNGAARWVQVGGLSFQVAELIKLTLVIWVACFLANRIKNDEMDSADRTLKPLLIVLLLIAVLVAGLESDLGSAGVMIAILGTMAFTAGLPFKRIALIVGVISIGTILAVSSSGYRRDRVATFLNPSRDCQASGYQACQALIAVGSGGVLGLGLGKSVQAYGYLPEAANDSIFAVLAEKFGFIGVSGVLGLYLLLFSRMRRIIERTADPFSKLLVIGILAWLSTQAIINIGAMIGLLPLKGITLPFISYGGTSLLFVMAAVGIVFQISRYTSFEPIRTTKPVKKETDHDDSLGRRRVGRPYYATTSNRS